MIKELILKDVSKDNVYMAAMLKCSSAFKEAKVRLLKPGENSKSVNVNRSEVSKNCPSWASSQLMYLFVRHNICDPIFEKQIDIEDKVEQVKNALIAFANKKGIELPK